MLFASLLLTATIPVDAQQFQYGNLMYAVRNSSEVRVTYQNVLGNYPDLTEVTIPSEVYYNGKYYTVTTIDNYAFRNAANLRSVVIPNTVTMIGDGAFQNASRLENVILEDGSSSVYMSRSGYWSDDDECINYPPFYYSPLKYVYLGRPINVNAADFIGWSNARVEVPASAGTSLKSMRARSITMQAASAPTLTSHSYGYAPADTLYVPVGSRNSYANASEWKKASVIIERSFQKSPRIKSLNKNGGSIDINFTPVSGASYKLICEYSNDSGNTFVNYATVQPNSYGYYSDSDNSVNQKYWRYALVQTYNGLTLQSPWAYTDKDGVFEGEEFEAHTASLTGFRCKVLDASTKSVELLGFNGNLTNLTLDGLVYDLYGNPYKITNIPKLAFAKTKLEKVTLATPWELTVGQDAFSRCDDLTTFNIGANVVLDPAFARDDRKLTTITVGQNHPYYMVRDNLLIDTSVAGYGETLFHYPLGKLIAEKKCVVPEGIERIGKYAVYAEYYDRNNADDYYDNEISINEIVLPYSLKCIVENAFACIDTKEMTSKALIPPTYEVANSYSYTPFWYNIRMYQENFYIPLGATQAYKDSKLIYGMYPVFIEANLLNVPMMKDCSDVTDSAFTANWESLPDIVSYSINVEKLVEGSEDEYAPLEGYTNLNVGNVTSYVVNVGDEPCRNYRVAATSLDSTGFVSPMSEYKIATLLIIKELTVNYSGQGEVLYEGGAIGSGTTYEDAEAFDFIVLPNDGWKIGSITLEGEDISEQLVNHHLAFAAPNGRATLDILFAEDAPVVVEPAYATLSVTNNSGHTHTHYYAEGQEVKVAFSPSADWKLHSVSLNGEDVTNDLDGNALTIPSINGENTLDVVYGENVATQVEAVGADMLRVHVSGQKVTVSGKSPAVIVRICDEAGTVLYTGSESEINLDVANRVILINVAGQTFKAVLR